MSPKDVLPVYSGTVPAIDPGAKKRMTSTRSILISISVVFLFLWYYAFPERCMLGAKNIFQQSVSSSDRRVHLVKARHGAVASQNKQCSDIGVDVLKRGGNAVDAAVSTTFCIGVVNMFL